MTQESAAQNIKNQLQFNTESKKIGEFRRKQCTNSSIGP